MELNREAGTGRGHSPGLIGKWINAGVLEDGRFAGHADGGGPGAGDQPAAGQHLPALRARRVV